MSLVNTLKNEFDKIYILHYVDNAERMKNIRKQLSYIGLDEKDVYIWLTTGTYLLNIAYAALMALPDEHKSKLWHNAGGLDATLNHIKIAKCSYMLGYKRILVLENDFHIMKDLDLVDSYMSTLPGDFNSIQFDYTWANNNVKVRDRINNSDKFIKLNPDENFWMADAYALDSTAMSIIDSLHVKSLSNSVADLHLYAMPNASVNKTPMSSYITNKKLFISDTYDGDVIRGISFKDDIVKLNTQNKGDYLI